MRDAASARRARAAARWRRRRRRARGRRSGWIFCGSGMCASSSAASRSCPSATRPWRPAGSGPGSSCRGRHGRLPRPVSAPRPGGGLRRAGLRDRRAPSPSGRRPVSGRAHVALGPRGGKVRRSVLSVGPEPPAGLGRRRLFPLQRAGRVDGKSRGALPSRPGLRRCARRARRPKGKRSL